MMPTFSIEWNASNRLSSCLKSAYVTPPRAESSPSPSTSAPTQAGGASEPFDEHAHEAVDRDLDHDAAHQRRHVRGRDRMGAREPRVEGHHPRLRAESDDRREGDDSLDAGSVGERGRIADRALMREQEQGDPDPGAAEVGDRDVDEDRAAGTLVGVADEDDRRRYERHQLPEEEERERVTGAENAGEGEHERRCEEAGGAAGAGWLQVPGGEHERGEGDQAERAEEEPGQPVDTELGRQLARERGAPGAAVGERPEARHPDRERARRLQPEPCHELRRSHAERSAENDRHEACEQDDDHSDSSSSSSDLLLLERAGDERAPDVEQREDLGIGGAVVDARAFLARLDEPDAAQGREMLGGAAGVEAERLLEGADGMLAVPEELEDPHPSRVPERAEERRLGDVERCRREWHARNLRRFQDIVGRSTTRPVDRRLSSRLTVDEIGSRA